MRERAPRSYFATRRPAHRIASRYVTASQRAQLAALALRVFGRIFEFMHLRLVRSEPLTGPATNLHDPHCILRIHKLVFPGVNGADGVFIASGIALRRTWP